MNDFGWRYFRQKRGEGQRGNDHNKSGDRPRRSNFHQDPAIGYQFLYLDESSEGSRDKNWRGRNEKWKRDFDIIFPARPIMAKLMRPQNEDKGNREKESTRKIRSYQRCG